MIRKPYKPKENVEIERKTRENKLQISKLLTDAPLYKQVELKEFYPNDVFFLQNQTFNFFCGEEKSNQTFELAHSHGEFMLAYNPLRDITVGNKINNFTEHFIGKCSSCKKYEVNFLINVYGKKPKNPLQYEGDVQESFFIRKIGQFPSFEIKPEKEIFDYLSEEDGEFYKKALMNLSQSYGIGAFAYFRRIIENQIKKLILDISNLNFDGSLILKDALDKYDQDKQMNNLINSLNGHLPNSLTSFGDNPIKKLYDQLSSGLHRLSDEDCLNRAINIDIILKFVVNQINKEKRDFVDVKNALKSLDTF